MSGKVIRIVKLATMVNRNGQMPQKMVPIGTSGAMPRTTNTLTPTGGLIRPISNIITMTTPNQIGLNPNSNLSGGPLNGGRPVQIIGQVTAWKYQLLNTTTKLLRRSKFRMQKG